MRRPLISLVGIIAVVASAAGGEAWGEGPPPPRRPPGPAGTDLPKRTSPYDLLVASSTGVVNLVFDQATSKYTKRQSLERSNIKHVLATSHHLLAASTDELIRIGADLKERDSRKLGKIGAVAAYGRNIAVSHGGTFALLDENLKELGKVDLLCGSRKKNAHDILIRGNTAYLLDNIMRPLYVFRVDLSKPAQPRIKEQIKFRGVNAHLSGQWVNPELNQWLILQTYSVMTGYGASVIIYPLDSGSTPLGRQRIFFSRRGRPKPPATPEQQHYIKAVTPAPPVWAVTVDSKVELTLTRIDSKDSQIKFSKVLALGKCAGSFWSCKRLMIKGRDGLLFVASDAGQLTVIDTRKSPKIILKADLQSHGIGLVTDIFPY